MSEKNRGEAIARRKARILEHLRQGKTSGEICDLEGLDPANEPKRMKREVADPAGVSINPGKNTALPVGLLDIDRLIRKNLRDKLDDLRYNHHYVDISHMIGLTNIEQQRALKDPYTHNWTLSQIQRLAAAHGMTFEEMMIHMQKPWPADFRKKK